MFPHGATFNEQFQLSIGDLIIEFVNIHIPAFVVVKGKYACHVTTEIARNHQVALYCLRSSGADLAIQQPGVELLMKCMEGVKDDPITYDLLKDYLKDEEEDLFWSQGAVELIEKIGVQNWLMLQL